jgi:hypothetical protein
MHRTQPLDKTDHTLDKEDGLHHFKLYFMTALYSTVI